METGGARVTLVTSRAKGLAQLAPTGALVQALSVLGSTTSMLTPQHKCSALTLGEMLCGLTSRADKTVEVVLAFGTQLQRPADPALRPRSGLLLVDTMERAFSSAASLPKKTSNSLTYCLHRS